MKTLELLAPARDADTAIEAIRHGADAVYIGAPAFGARAAAGNSLSDLQRVVDYAHAFAARVYVTVNTIVYDHELAKVEQLIRQLWRIGVDALIVQDMGLLRLDLPPIVLHASTQCDTRTAAKARFLQDVGFSQIVLARELSLEEIADIARAVTVPVEVFVHGALCVSYSGDCHAGALTMGRSANRGECPQICRLRYSLSDADGNRLAPDGHWLSLRDMNRLDSLEALIEAGASSFKIEGRLKDTAYVKNVVAAYSRELDRIIARYPDRYCRSSQGRVEVAFRPEVARSFNRGFTSYFLGGRPAVDAKMASWRTPKWAGPEVGRVKSCRGKCLEVTGDTVFANGDGIGWFADGRLMGARIDRADGHTLWLAEASDIPAGTVLYRNRDRNRDELMAGRTAVRTIDIDMTLRRNPAGDLVLDVSDDYRHRASAVLVVGELAPARTPQLPARRRTLERLGDTVYILRNLDDRLGDLFLPASQLTNLRRRAIEAFDRARRLDLRLDRRRAEDRTVPYMTTTVDYHTNIANAKAREFYRDHGVTSQAPAAELQAPAEAEPVVMTTRYCLRRELGKCIRRGHVPGPWLLRATDGPIALRVDFDCARCGQTISLHPSR